jgi:phosphoribosylaminoimidazolecarboxamide formyltransferase/IMP cyclohydrolase
MKRLALLSVHDKSGIVEFARGLEKRGFEILSTGGTAETLRAAGLDVINVSYYTGMPEVLGGRVKTLHPKIHAGLLAKPDDPKHFDEMAELNIRRIEVLAVNLYPFEQTVLGGRSREEIIENIDIGGPAMIRAAAKNAASVMVITDPGDYTAALKQLSAPGDPAFKESLRAKAFAHTAFYDSLVAEFLDGGLPKAPGETLTVGFRLRDRLRYGENPHQSAGLFTRPFQKGGIVAAEQLWGKELSYNNILDADAAWELACELQTSGPRACVIVKHGNPCGAAWGYEPSACFLLARSGDPVSAFGGIVALPGELDADTAHAMVEKGTFFEVIACSGIGEEAFDVFKSRSGWGKDVRILVVPPSDERGYLSVRTLRGGALVQDADSGSPAEWLPVTVARPTPDQSAALKAAWTVVKHVKSNAIVVANEVKLLGVGAGQMNRVQSVRLALAAAGEFSTGAVLASDAFFPFPDSIEEAAKAGIAAIIQPGGSKKDPEVVEAANRLGIAMVFTGVRHFRH